MLQGFTRIAPLTLGLHPTNSDTTSMLFFSPASTSCSQAWRRVRGVQVYILVCAVRGVQVYILVCAAHAPAAPHKHGHDQHATLLARLHVLRPTQARIKPFNPEFLTITEHAYLAGHHTKSGCKRTLVASMDTQP